MLQNLPYFWNTKTNIGIKNEKKLHGFSYSKNMANFESFRWNISSSINFFFQKSDLGRVYNCCNLGTLRARSSKLIVRYQLISYRVINLYLIK